MSLPLYGIFILAYFPVKNQMTELEGVQNLESAGRRVRNMTMQSTAGGEGHQEQSQWWKVESDLWRLDEGPGLALWGLWVPQQNRPCHIFFCYILTLMGLGYGLNIGRHLLPVGPRREHAVTAHHHHMSLGRGLKASQNVGGGGASWII